MSRVIIIRLLLMLLALAITKPSYAQDVKGRPWLENIIQNHSLKCNRKAAWCFDEGEGLNGHFPSMTLVHLNGLYDNVYTDEPLQRKTKVPQWYADFFAGIASYEDIESSIEPGARAIAQELGLASRDINPIYAVKANVGGTYADEDGRVTFDMVDVQTLIELSFITLGLDINDHLKVLRAVATSPSEDLEFEGDIAIFDASRNEKMGHMVFVAWHLQSALSFMRFHELGHIYLGHLETMSPTCTQLAQEEVEADVFGISSMSSALSMAFHMSRIEQMSSPNALQKSKAQTKRKQIEDTVDASLIEGTFAPTGFRAAIGALHSNGSGCLKDTVKQRVGRLDAIAKKFDVTGDIMRQVLEIDNQLKVLSK